MLTGLSYFNTLARGETVGPIINNICSNERRTVSIVFSGTSGKCSGVSGLKEAVVEILSRLGI